MRRLSQMEGMGWAEETGETSNASGEGTQHPPVAEMGWVDESSEREGRER